MFKKFIGDRQFYKTVLAVAVPIMIQNGITNFVALLDNIMVGQIGTEQMSGTAIANQILFVFNLCIFGILSGPGIYGAQFFGKGSSEGIRQTFRFKLIVSMMTLTAGLLILTFFGEPLVMSYLTGSGEEGDKALTLQSGLDYLHIMMVGLVPFTVTQVFLYLTRNKQDGTSDACRHGGGAGKSCSGLGAYFRKARCSRNGSKRCRSGNRNCKIY